MVEKGGKTAVKSGQKMKKNWSERRDFYHVSRGEPSTFSAWNGPSLGKARGVSRPDAPNAGDHHPILETSHGIGPVCNLEMRRR